MAVSVAAKCKLLFAALVVGLAIGTTATVHVRAISLTTPVTQFASAACPKKKLLGVFVPWYQYLKVNQDKDTGSCGVPKFQLLPGIDSEGKPKNSDIPLVLLAIVDDMVRLAGFVAVIFVILGGIKYATSQGSPDETAKAQSTIINALIGLAIAMVAVAFVAFLGGALTP